MKNPPSASKRRRAALCAAALVAMLATFGGVDPAHASAEAGQVEPAPEMPLDINRASADELTALPGIGPTMARRIVDFRDRQGRFRRVEDLMRVKGIGEKSFEKLRPMIKVEKEDRREGAL